MYYVYVQIYMTLPDWSETFFASFPKTKEGAVFSWQLFLVFFSSHFYISNPDFTAQKMKLRIWSYLLKKSLMKNFVFCAVFEWLLCEINRN